MSSETQSDPFEAYNQNIAEALRFIDTACTPVTDSVQVYLTLLNSGYEVYMGSEFPDLKKGIHKLRQGDLEVEVFNTLIGVKEKKPVVQLVFHAPCFQSECLIERQLLQPAA